MLRLGGNEMFELFNIAGNNTTACKWRISTHTHTHTL